MNSTRLVLVSLLLALPAINGCSKSAPSATGPTAQAAPSPTDASISTAVAAASREGAKACELITSAEMSAILGSTVVGTEPANKSSGKTDCIYKPADAPSPYVEFSIEWGEGQTAMTAVGAMNQVEPGITNPYAGIGDQAAAVGTALMIRTGEDLVTITFSGVEGAPSKAKQIFDTAKARM